MSKLAIVIMVKNESAIIERCLCSIAPYADLVIITDTGSTDDTMYKAGMFLQNHNIKFKIYNEPFVDFGHNRTRLLHLANKEKDIEYVLMIDADEVLEGDFNKNVLWGELYDIEIKTGDLSYRLPRITKNCNYYYYTGVTHEYLSHNRSVVSYPLNGFHIRQLNDSFRRKSGRKWVEDVQLLNAAIEKITDENLKARYLFYLAQTYKDLGWVEAAEPRYQERLKYGGWNEERFYCHYQLGLLETKKHKPIEESIIKDCLAAFELCPHRVESLIVLRDYWKGIGKISSANIIEKTIKSIPCPTGGLFVEQDKYAKIF